MEKELTLPRPDDWHLHLRDGAILEAVLPATAAHFGRAIIMPNLVPPVVRVKDARQYREQIIEALPQGLDFEPLMTLYLTGETEPADLQRGAEEGLITAVKLYPAGATTNSASGVKSIDKVMPVLEVMAEIGLPLCVHGEVTDNHIDIFDREAVFIDRVLEPLRHKLPDLRIVFEHVTTKDAVDFVMAQQRNVAATITPHHLAINRNHLLVGGIRPHYYCLPVAKRALHQEALLVAATSGDRRFFLGTDSAPHLDHAKETACGCAGIFNSVNALSCLAQIFENAGALDRLSAFCSQNGPGFYRLPVNQEMTTLIRQDDPITFPEKLDTPEGPVTIFDPGFPIYWDVKS